MSDVEKALSTSGPLYRDGSNNEENPPVSDASSQEAEKEIDLEKNQPVKEAPQPDAGKDTMSGSTSNSMIVDWNGADDPEFPQNL